MRNTQRVVALGYWRGEGNGLMDARNIVFWLAAALVCVAASAGCKDKGRQQAAEARRLRAELMKTRAELAQVKGERSYLRERLQTTTQTQDQLLEQINALVQERDELIDDANSTEKTDANTAVQVDGQNKKIANLESQNEKLKGLIEELTGLIRRQQETIGEQRATIERMKTGIKQATEPNT
jgi:chromosome segregation ATPase